MSGALLIKMSVAPTPRSVESIIGDVLRGSVSYLHVEKMESGIQCVVFETEVAIFDELQIEFAAHDWICSRIMYAIHCVAPGAVLMCSAIWLSDDQWFIPRQAGVSLANSA